MLTLKRKKEKFCLNEHVNEDPLNVYLYQLKFIKKIYKFTNQKF